MKLLCYKDKLVILFALIIMSEAFSKNLAFYYDKDVPEELLKVYDYVVVNVEDISKNVLKKYNKKLVAYISIEEVSDKTKAKKEWILGKNKNWDSLVTDIRNKDYRKSLLNKIKNFRKEGINSFFFDTLDSYQLALKKKDWKSYENALANFIIEVKKQFPNSKIFLNRGFEVFDKVYPYINGVVAESLFRGYNGKNYYEVSKEDRKWLINKLNYIKSKNIPVYVIDYVKPNEKNLARKLAEKIEKLGFIPYITNKDLSIIGLSNFEIFPRKVLVIYKTKDDVAYSNAHRLIQMPLEYLGYVADLKTPKEAMQLKHTIDRYAGMVVWLENDIVKNYDKFYNWILKRIKNGNKILFLGYFGFPETQRYLKPLGLTAENNKAGFFSKNKVIFQDKIVGFEEKPPLNITPDSLIKTNKGKPLLILKNSKNQEFHPITITPWGGYVLEQYLTVDVGDIIKWIPNPFELLKRSLRLKPFPAPDFTTENGMRVLFSHIDGDGSVSLCEFCPTKKFAMEVIRDEILKKYKIPIGVSFIEAEIMPYGVYPQYSKKAIEVAKSIYALDNVEPASHTFSHPFKWMEISKLKDKNEIPEGYNLKIPNYKFSLYREIVDSVKNLSKLCPPNKKVNILYWSGDCNPPKKALKIAYEHNILNINGGDTYITKDRPFLSLVAPAGLKRGEYYQIYDGEQNEELYTDDFTKNFWGYKKVIETFQLTDKPRRLKPIDIYYHFFSGTKLASLNALKEVYNYALKQDVIPMKVSEYILKVLDFYHSAIAKEGDYWIIKTDKNLRTLKVPKGFGYPNLETSKGVIGFYPYNDQLYISLDGSGNYKIKFTENRPNQTYIKQTNARIKKVNKNEFSLKGYQPVKVIFNKLQNCKIYTKNKYKKIKNMLIFNTEKVEFKLECN
ncbi:endo alpha-1,4 polygalactosaminidase [Hydrogenothermus marinus]|uniref:Glycosyl hydrolase family 114 n=1 Tax=Hydrogenothermus marinus TaxID=133270 RepID=A0A3M0C3X3_9AQUI|nr:endo alpha-1,4 polygalactosaminidase [Hydrogenothermus marinus]RMA97662.1 glycosyl hydrolase family 114 [Hydrogenothermus marinus]